MKKHYLFIPLVVFLLICSVFVWQLLRNAQGEKPTDLESVLIGKPLPNFTIEALEEDRTFQRTDLINGKPFLLTVWATWCPTCYEEHHYLNVLARQGIRLIGVDYKDDRQKALNWLAQLKNPFEINLADPNGSAGLDLGVYGAPETFLVDGHGIIRYKLVGPVHEQVWKTDMFPIWQHYAGDKP